MGDRLKPKDEILALRRETLLNKAAMENANARLTVLKSRLAYFSGEKDSSALDLTGAEADEALLCSEDLLSQLRDQVKEIDPGLQVLRAEKEKQAAKIRWVKSERFPELLAVVRHTHDPRFGESPDQTFTGIRFEQEFWGFGALTHKIRQENYSLDAQNQRLENEERRLLLRFDEAVQAYKGSYALWEGQVSYLEMVRQVMEETLHRYNTGESSWKQYALSKIEYLHQRNEVETARFDVLKNKADIWYFLESRSPLEGTP